METNIQSDAVRKYVLEHLENGSFFSGMRLPGFRRIADELNISGPIVQKSLDTLVNEGILRSEPRSGLYVEPEWQCRPIAFCAASLPQSLERISLSISTLCNHGCTSRCTRG